MNVMKVSNFNMVSYFLAKPNRHASSDRSLLYICWCFYSWNAIRVVEAPVLFFCPCFSSRQPPEKNRFGDKKVNGTSKKPADECDTCTEDTESIQSGGRG